MSTAWLPVLTVLLVVPGCGTGEPSPLDATPTSFLGSCVEYCEALASAPGCELAGQACALRCEEFYRARQGACVADYGGLFACLAPAFSSRRLPIVYRLLACLAPR